MMHKLMAITSNYLYIKAPDNKFEEKKYGICQRNNSKIWRRILFGYIF